MATTTFTLVPIPLWYFADLTGIPLGGGYLKTFRSVDQTTPKPIFTDSTGQFAYPNPVFFNLNGEAPGPFFWANDEPYFIELFNANNGLIFTMSNYGPGIAGGGGGGSITVNNNLENFIINNDFLRNGGTFNNIQSGTVIAPSKHQGLIKTSTTVGGSFPNVPFVGPDIMFIRSNDTGTDNLTFATSDFNAGLVPLTGDVTPEFYIQLQNTGAPGSETSKAIQFPIDLHVKNLEQQPVTLIIWAKSNSGTPALTANLVQYFGTGSATTPVLIPFPINAGTLAGSWQPYVGTIASIPSIAGKTLSVTGDDATYVQINFPTAQNFNISITKPKFYLGTIANVFPELQTYDFVSSTIDAPRTGDVKISLDSFDLFGWVPANDGTIGLSGASTRSNADTWPLYYRLWSDVLDHWAPVTGGRGASAFADFSANKPIMLTRALGRVLAGINSTARPSLTFTTNHAVSNSQLIVSSSANFVTGTPVQLTNSGGALPAGLSANTIYFAINVDATHLQLATSVENAFSATSIVTFSADGTGTSTIQTALGATFGESNHVLVNQEMPSTITLDSTTLTNLPGTGAQTLIGLTGAGTTSVIVAGAGGGHNTIQPTTYLNIFYKL